MNLQLANNIRRLRREKNLTQDDIATELRISYQAVSRWETGAPYPDVELLPALAAILGVSMDALFGMGNVENGYAALEKAVDLYIAYDQLPDGKALCYNCSALDMLRVTVDKSEGSACSKALRILTDPQGWEWFNGVRGEERYQKQVERLKAATVE